MSRHDIITILICLPMVVGFAIIIREFYLLHKIATKNFMNDIKNAKT